MSALKEMKAERKKRVFEFRDAVWRRRVNRSNSNADHWLWIFNSCSVEMCPDVRGLWPGIFFRRRGGGGDAEPVNTTSEYKYVLLKWIFHTVWACSCVDFQICQFPGALWGDLKEEFLPLFVEIFSRHGPVFPQSRDGQNEIHDHCIHWFIFPSLRDPSGFCITYLTRATN